MVNPEEADRDAKADQAGMIALYGGEAVLRAKEPAAFTPPPGVGGH
jgi:hypothetical protein